MNSTLRNKVKAKIRNIKNRLQVKKWPVNSIVIFCPPNTPQKWTAKSLKSGIGGSQLAIIHLSKQWIEAGYEITVYNNCGAEAKAFSGVEYVDYHHFNPFDEFSTLIVWRMPWRMHFPNRAQKVLLDLHETLIPEQREFRKLKNYDKIFVKSQYHRIFFSETPDSKIEIIPNGVDKSYQALYNITKDPYRIVYASNYSRGLEQMLEHGWPAIHQAYPQAELHIYYGWSLPENPSTEQKKLLKLMQQPGVFEHGKVGQDELMQAKAKSAIHYYGCTFQEIDCISVRESALVGCIPVTTDYAVLSEKKYCLTVPGGIKDPNTHIKLAQKIVELLESPEELDKLRPNFSKHARQETWDCIAWQWTKFMN